MHDEKERPGTECRAFFHAGDMEDGGGCVPSSGSRMQGRVLMIAEQFDAFFFDLDGVIYIGGSATPGAAGSLQTLRRMGKGIRFLTNNPTDRQRIASRLRNHGIEAEMGEIVTAGSATAQFLAGEGIRRVWVIGEEGLRSEIEGTGIIAAREEQCEAVVVGWDDGATMADIRRAALAIRKGALFVAANADPSYPSPEGPVAGVGVIVEALRAGSGKEPVVVGKPFIPMFREAIASVGIPPGRIAMVGDTPDIDVTGAHRAGITALLMGDAPVSGEGDPFRRPEGRIETLRDLLKPGGKAGIWKFPETE